MRLSLGVIVWGVLVLPTSSGAQAQLGPAAGSSKWPPWR